MVIDFNRPSNGPGSSNAGRAGGVQANEQSANPVSSNQAKSSAATSGQSPDQAKDTVQLSSDAQQLQKLSDKLKDTPSIDKERVARLKQAVAEGTYIPDSARVAEKLLKLESQY